MVRIGGKHRSLAGKYWLKAVCHEKVSFDNE